MIDYISRLSLIIFLVIYLSSVTAQGKGDNRFPVKKGYTSDKEKNGIAESKINKKDRISIDIPDSKVMNIFNASLHYITQNESAVIKNRVCDDYIIRAALLRCGYYKITREYINLLVSEQRPSGEIPCKINIDNKNKIESESSADFLYAAAEYYHFTKDKQFIKNIYPSLVKAAEFINSLIKQGETDKNKDTEFYGILPASISYENGIKRKSHNYSDDWKTLKGIKDLQYLAGELGKTEDTKWIGDLETKLRNNLLASIKLTMKKNNSRFIPSDAEGNNDISSNFISVWPCDEEQFLPEGLIKSQIDYWYKNILLPEKEKKSNFTSDEITSVTALLILGDKEKALAILDFFSSNYFPADRNGNVNIDVSVYSVNMSRLCAQYITALRNCLVYEKNNTVILGAGLKEEWIKADEQISIKDFPVYLDKISYTLLKTGDNLKIKISGRIQPREGFSFKLPYNNKKVKSVILNGTDWEIFSDKEIYFGELPAEILVKY